MIDTHTGEGSPDDWDLDAMWTELGTLFPISISIDEVITEAGSKGKATREFLGREILSDAQLAYQKREELLGDEAMRELERRVVLSVIDRRWRDHLYGWTTSRTASASVRWRSATRWSSTSAWATPCSRA